MNTRTSSIKLGLVGTGQLARSFIPLFNAHPQVRAVALCDLLPERLAEEASLAGIAETYPDLDALLASDCDAIAIFTPRQTHAPLTLAALKAGRHVYSAVPVGVSIKEIREIEAMVRATGLVYMLGETSYYYPSTILCRELWRQGLFGRFVFGEAEYMHDMDHGFYEAFQRGGGSEWKRVAGIPPMFYSTHSASMITSVTGAYFSRVACLGQRDEHEDGIFRKGANHWDNEFSNETALLRTSDGGIARLNEFRRIGLSGGRSVRLSLFGTRGSYEEQPGGEVFSTHDGQIFPLRELLRCAPISAEDKATEAGLPANRDHDFYAGMAAVHPRWRLPEEFAELPSGHYGSHQFLVDDFVRACVTGSQPPNHIWDAARYNLPGLVAHESTLQEGQMFEIPDLGGPPPGHHLLEDDLAALAPEEPGWVLPDPEQA